MDLKSLNWKGLEIPKKLSYEKETFCNTYAKFFAEPFEKGYGITLGNSIRRILLSSLVGATVTNIKIDGILHEFSIIPNVKEDASIIILNIKQLWLKLYNEGTEYIYIDERGPKEITAADIKINNNVEILNPHLHIASLSKDAHLKIEMMVEWGRGYVFAEENKKPDQPIGMLSIDSIFSPVQKVNFYVENTQVGQITDYDKLIIEIWTNGSIRPDDALAYAAKILKNYLTIFINFEEEPEVITEEFTKKEVKQLEYLSKDIDDLELSVRSYNCLKAVGIRTIGDLIQKTESEMLLYRNFGRKSLNELKDILEKMDLSFGIKLDVLLKKTKI